MTWTYAEVGATRDGVRPPGYRWLNVRHRLGRGDVAGVGEALLTWRLHAAAGITLAADAPRAAPGVGAEARLGIGPLRLPAPCRVVWVEEGARRYGFGYGTLPGHVFVGEEAFTVERDADGVVWFVVQAFSRPARWPLQLARPAVALGQRAFVGRLAAGARSLLS